MCSEMYRKYIKGAGLEDALVETGVFGVLMELIPAVTNYLQSLRGIQILSGAIELVK